MHFAARKNVLEYDDVMNLQRKAIYEERNAILDGKDMEGRIPEIVADAVEAVVERELPRRSCPSDDWDLQGGRFVGGHYDGPERLPCGRGRPR